MSRAVLETRFNYPASLCDKNRSKASTAEKRRVEIERQLAGSKYGIAYTDGTERITQLNRSVENNLMKQIEYLTSMLYSQLGITQSILDGSADEKTMLNYYNRTIEPIISAIVDEMKRKFLTKTARSQKQSILFFRDPNDYYFVIIPQLLCKLRHIVKTLALSHIAATPRITFLSSKPNRCFISLSVCLNTDVSTPLWIVVTE